MYIYSQTASKSFLDHNNNGKHPLKSFKLKVSLAGT
jgi:hypothetical protein